MATVTLTNICKRYEGPSSQLAVDNVNLDIADGEFMVLLGPSGCGKSTTLRMIAGLESISSGALSIGGTQMNNIPAKDRDIAMVFQSYALYPHMSVAENLAFGLRRRNFPGAEIDRRVKSVAGTLGLEPLLARKPHALSGGQRQRVALGRAMVREPVVFLFDEPLSNLDAALRVNTRNELIRQHHRLRSTMVYVTHDQIEAMTMGTRICVMNGGKVAQVGKPLDVYWQPADTFVARFLGSPPMNLFPATLVSDAAGYRAQNEALATPLGLWDQQTLARASAGPITVGVRAEDLHLNREAFGTSSLGKVSGRTVAVEPLGAETLLLIETPAGECTARLPRSISVQPDENIDLFFSADAAYLFEGATGKAIFNDKPRALYPGQGLAQ